MKTEKNMTQIRIKYINNDGNGFADYVNIESGTTVGQFLASKGQNAANLQVTVNREAADVGRVLQAEDRLSVTPKKIAGAAVLVKVNTAEVEAVTAGKSVLELFRQFVGSPAPAGYLINIDGAPATPDERPRDGQTVTFVYRPGGAASAPAPAPASVSTENEYAVTVKADVLVKQRELTLVVSATNVEQAIAKAKALRSFEVETDNTDNTSSDLSDEIVYPVGGIAVQSATLAD